MSQTPFADSVSYDLRRHLEDTTVGPAEMFALALTYRTDSEAVYDLCGCAAGSFRRLVGLYAAREHITAKQLESNLFNPAPSWLCDRIDNRVIASVSSATAADLLEGLAVARTVFAGGTSRTFRAGPLYVSELFATYAPHKALTDKVVAGMSLPDTEGLSQGWAFASRPNAYSPQETWHSQPVDVVVSKYLVSRFGFHDPPWNMFRHVHTPEATVREVADLVAAVEPAPDRPY